MIRPVLAIAIAILCLAAPVTRSIAQEAPPVRAVDGWTSEDLVVVGTLDRVVAGPVAGSFPPIHNHTLSITVTEVLRGDAKVGQTIEAHHAARQHEKPTFPEGKRVIVAIKRARGLSVQRLVEADDQKIVQLRDACSLPVGWTVAEGALHSPWAKLGESAWANQPAAPEGVRVCAVTGRPAYLLPAGVDLSVAPVPPAKEIKWANPDGDGEYRITLTNTTDQPIKIDAVRRVGDKVLWNESIVILCQGKAYTVPGAIGVAVATEPLTLEPGASASHVVNALTLKGPEWPRGGYRIEFTFAIGQKSSTQSLYYMSRHHDALRDKAQAGLKIDG